VHERAAGSGRRGDRGQLGVGSLAAPGGHQRVQHVPDPAGEARPVIRAGRGDQGGDRREGAELGQPVQQHCQVGDDRLLGSIAADPPERVARQPGRT